MESNHQSFKNTIITELTKWLSVIILLFIIIIITILVIEKEYETKTNKIMQQINIDDRQYVHQINWPDEYGKSFNCNNVIYDDYLYISLSKNDIYKVEFINKAKIIDYIIINTNIEKKNDKHLFMYLIPNHITEKGYNYINVSPISGDGKYSIYSLTTLKDPNTDEYKYDTKVDFEIDKIEINIEEEYLHKIENDRRKAIELGILISDGIYMPANTIVNGKKYKTELRLKGDWTDHLASSKWSLRIKVKGDCIWGMNEFSIQEPNSRRGIGEYLIQEYYRQAGGVALRYSFVDVIINGTYMGVYAVEEGFNKRAVENSLKREGIIIKPNEAVLWEARAYYITNNDKIVGNIEYKPFSMSKTINNKKLRDYASYSINNLNSFFVDKSISFSEVFDVEMYASYLAILEIFQSTHGTTWHNLRYYYNPITALLEPIPFDELIDSTGGVIANNYEKHIVNFLNNDDSLKKQYFSKLYEYAEAFDNFISKESNNINKYSYILSRDGYSNINFSKIYSTVETILASKVNQGVRFECEYLDNKKTKINIINSNIFPINIKKILYHNKEVSFDQEIVVNDYLYHDYIIINYTLPNIPNKTYSKKVEEPPLSFYIAGNVYGALADGNDGIHKVFKEYLQTIKSKQRIEFGFLLGDIVYNASKESFQDVKDTMALIEKPYYLAAGNLDKKGGDNLIEEYFGELYYSFKQDNNLFIVLDPQIDWCIDDMQLEFLNSVIKK